MKTIFKWLFRLVLLLAVITVTGVLLMDTMVKAVAEYELKRQTGLEVEIGKAEVGLLNPTFRLENLVVYNTAEFGGGPLVAMPELHIEYDRRALLDRKVHLTLFRLDLARIELVQNQAGKFNLGPFEEKLKSQTKSSPGGFSGYHDFKMDFSGIDTLNLSVGKFKFTNLKTPDDSREFNVGIQHQVLTNLKNEQQFADAITTLLFQKAASLMMQNFGGTAPAAKQNQPVLPKTPPAKR